MICKDYVRKFKNIQLHTNLFFTNNRPPSTATNNQVEKLVFVAAAKPSNN